MNIILAGYRSHSNSTSLSTNAWLACPEQDAQHQQEASIGKRPTAHVPVRDRLSTFTLQPKSCDMVNHCQFKQLLRGRQTISDHTSRQRRTLEFTTSTQVSIMLQPQVPTFNAGLGKASCLLHVQRSHPRSRSSIALELRKPRSSAQGREGHGKSMGEDPQLKTDQK